MAGPLCRRASLSGYDIEVQDMKRVDKAGEQQDEESLGAKQAAED
jgi:hypothetical protein